MSMSNDEIELYVDNQDAAKILKKKIGEKATEFKSDELGKVNAHGMPTGLSFKEKTPQTLKDVKVSPIIAGTYE